MAAESGGAAPRLVTLPDGRRLAYTETGDPGGRAVVFCHGLWNSRLSHGPSEELVRRLGVRFLAVDRPGIGRSDPAPRRRMLDWPDDVGGLADTLGLDTFAIVGFSGGGPFALACGARLAERVTTVAVAGSYAPIRRPGGLAGFRPELAAVLRVARCAPRVVEALFSFPVRSVRRDPLGFARARSKGAPECDRAVGDRPEIFERAALGTVEAARQGPRALAWEFALLGRSWGFGPADLRVPVLVLHGADDRDAPVGAAAWLAAALPEARLSIVPGAGHLVMCDRWEQLLLHQS